MYQYISHNCARLDTPCVFMAIKIAETNISPAERPSSTEASVSWD